MIFELFRWGLLSWPWKITNMVAQVEEQHVEEEDKFRKLQIQDTASLNDRMDTLIVNYEFLEILFGNIITLYKYNK